MLLRKFNRQVLCFPTGNDEVITILKSQEVLDHMDEVEADVFALNLLDRYINRPDHSDFDQMCYTDFILVQKHLWN